MQRARWISLIMFFQLSVACTEKGKPYVEHESAPPPGQKKSVDPIKSHFNSAETRARFAASTDPLLEVLVPLAERVLALARVVDPQSLFDASVREELMALNSYLIKSTSVMQERSEFVGILKNYAQILELNCENLRASCTGINYLKISSDSSQVAKLLARKFSAQQFRYLLIALELSNQNWDGEMLQMLGAQVTSPLSAGETKSREAAQVLIGNALQLISNRLTEPEKIREYLESIQAWTLVTEKSDTLNPQSRQALFSLLARANMMYAKDGSLHPQLIAVMKQRETRENGFIKIQNEPQATNLVGAQRIDQFNEIYFILDGVFSGEIDPANAAQLFGNSRNSFESLKNALENYLRIQFVKSLSESTALAGKIFNADVRAPNLPLYAIEQSQFMRRIWGQFQSRALSLQTFALNAARSKGVKPEVVHSISRFFGSVDRSITLSSAYPHNLILFHKLSQTRFEIKALWGTVFDTGELMGKLFNKTLKPWLTYVDRPENLNAFQIVYAFDFGLRSHLFTHAKIDVDYFIADTLRRLTETPVSTIERTLESVTTAFQNSPSYLDFLRACSTLRERPVPRSFYFLENDQSPYYGALLSQAFSDVTPSAASGGDQPGQLVTLKTGIFYLDHRYSEMLEIARLDLGHYVRLGQGLLKAYESYLQQTGHSPKDQQAKTQQSVQALARLEALRSRVLKTGGKWFSDVGECYWPAIIKDRKVQMQVVKMESAYLRQVYRNIRKLRDDSSPASSQTAQAKIQFHGLPSDFKGLDRISKNGYLYNKIDLQVRMARYVQLGLTTELEKFPPIDAQVRVDWGSRLDLEVPAVANSKQVFLSYLESEQAFVEAGLKVMFTGRDPTTGNEKYVIWSSSTPTVVKWSAYMTSLVSLHRLERELDGKNKSFPATLLLRSNEDILNLTKIFPEERALYNILGMFPADRRELSALHNRLIDYDFSRLRITQTHGLFDYLFKMVHKDQLGFRFELPPDMNPNDSSLRPRLGHFVMGDMYYNSRALSTRGTTVIPYSPELDQFLDQSMIRFVGRELQVTEQIQDHATNYFAQVVKRPLEDQPRADIELHLTIREPLLTPALVPDYKAKAQNFNRTTGNWFLNRQVPD